MMSGPSTMINSSSKKKVIVIGTGLAGLTTTHQLLSKGVNVILLEKTPVVGMASNSNKASSGINGVYTNQQKSLNIKDSVELFTKDTILSAKSSARPDLIQVLTSRSKVAIDWLTQSFEVDLSKVSRLGGHSAPRTHRGSGQLPPGYAIVSTLLKLLQKYEESNQLQILKKSRVTKLLSSSSSNSQNGEIYGLEYEDGNVDPPRLVQLLSDHIVLATGGFSADFGNNDDSLIAQYRSDLLDLPSTNGQQTTGDGIKLLRQVGAATVDMDKIQIHPTGFIDPNDVNSKWKFLAGEVLRGNGGILMDENGHRFVNELSTRDVVTQLIFESSSKHNQVWLVIPGDCFDDLKTHLGFYMSKKLITEGNLQDLANKMSIDNDVLISELTNYNKNSQLNEDKFHRDSFGPKFGLQLDSKVYYGLVTPVLHFCMGGLQIDVNTRVQGEQSGGPIKGLYAVGEVSGGVHGFNRLGGSSLLECVVFGTVASEVIYDEMKK